MPNPIAVTLFALVLSVIVATVGAIHAAPLGPGCLQAYQTLTDTAGQAQRLGRWTPELNEAIRQVDALCRRS